MSGIGEDPVGDEPTPCAYTDYKEHGGEAGEAASLPGTGDDATGAERRVWDELDDVEDPEMPVSVVDLGLIYGVSVDDGRAVVDMTLTYTGCPARETLTGDIKAAAASANGVDEADVRLVWSPPWTLEMVTEDGREALREFGVSV